MLSKNVTFNSAISRERVLTRRSPPAAQGNRTMSSAKVHLTKRKAISQIERSAKKKKTVGTLPGQQKTLQQYFSQGSNSNAATARPNVVDDESRFQRDLEKAIKLSLAECSNIQGETSENAVDNTDVKLSNNPAQEGNREISTPKATHTATESENKEDEPQESSLWRSLRERFIYPLTEIQNKRTSVPSTSVSKGNKKATNRKCPFYKWMQDTPYVIDAFSYGKIPNCEGYFLSHFHSDHFHGLGKTWSHGTIYCSRITANLLEQELKVKKQYICALPMDEEYSLKDTIKVSLIDANHCPGSVLFLFKILRPDGTVARHLHTGDFRATPRMCLHPSIRQPKNAAIDTLYLDTTYLDAQYSFPPQPEVIRAACNVAQEAVANEREEQRKDGVPQNCLDKWFKQEDGAVARRPSSKVLFVVGTYTIGKEKIFLEIAKTLNAKIYVSDKKRQIIKCQENEELESFLTSIPHHAQVHVLPLGDLKVQNLNDYLAKLEPYFTSIVAFRPTGWTFQSSDKQESVDMSLQQIIAAPTETQVVLRPQRASTSRVKIYGVPYSEHSSFRELAAFIASLDIRRIIPTVNVGSEKSRKKMSGYLDRWQQEKSKSGVVPYPSLDHW